MLLGIHRVAVGRHTVEKVEGFELEVDAATQDAAGEAGIPNGLCGVEAGIGIARAMIDGKAAGQVETPREGCAAAEPIAVCEGVERLETVTFRVRPFEATGRGEAIETLGIAEAEVLAEDGTADTGPDALRLCGEGEQIHAVAIVGSGVGGEVDTLLLVEWQAVGDVAVQVPVAVDTIGAVRSNACGRVVAHGLHERILPEGIAQCGVEITLLGL